jgi:hypothetical protein
MLEHVLGVAALEPTSLYLGVGTDSASYANENSWSAELSGNGYVRQPIAFGTPAASAITNTTDVKFPEATANWGQIAYYGVWTQESGGKLLALGQFSGAVTVNAGDILRVKPGQVLISGWSSLYLVHGLLGLVFGGEAFAMPADHHLALVTSLPDPEDTGSDLADAGDRVPWNSWNGVSVEDVFAKTDNNGRISFNEASGTINGCVLVDAETGGNWLMAGLLGPISFGADEQPLFDNGDLDVRLWALP